VIYYLLSLKNVLFLIRGKLKGRKTGKRTPYLLTERKGYFRLPFIYDEKNEKRKNEQHQRRDKI
jgi:hypothetical protein